MTTPPTAPAVEAELAASTRKTYAIAWRQWERWCSGRGIQPLPAPPEAIAAFLAERAEAGVHFSTLDCYCSGIAHRHRQEGLADRTADFLVRTFRVFEDLWQRTAMPEPRLYLSSPRPLLSPRDSWLRIHVGSFNGPRPNHRTLSRCRRNGTAAPRSRGSGPCRGGVTLVLDMSPLVECVCRASAERI